MQVRIIVCARSETWRFERVCPSVYRTGQLRLTFQYIEIALHHTTVFSSFLEAKFVHSDLGITPTSALKRGTSCRRRKLDQLSAIFRKRCKIGGKLLLFTHRKLHTDFVLTFHSYRN